MIDLITSEAVAALVQVVMIDLVLAGDNAVVIALAAAGLPPEQRRRVIIIGILAATALRIVFAGIAMQLLQILGLLLAGGILLLWVCWKMWRELREQITHDQETARAALDGTCPEPSVKAAKSFRQAFLQVLIADVSMSLDNVLAVAGAAREHPAILVFGLLLSIALMGLAASAIANLLHRFRWIGFVGLAIVLYVACHMVWEGHRSVVIDLHKVEAYNAAAPSFLDITKEELAAHRKHK
jgi:YjbE family integral membrane protein